MGMMLMSMIGSAALILGGIAGAGLLLYHSSMLSPVRIGVVFPQGSKTMSQAISLVETMNSFSSVCEIQEMHDAEEALDALSRSELQAVMIFPKHFARDLVNGANTPAELITGDSPLPETTLFREILQDGVVLIDSGESAIYAINDAWSSYQSDRSFDDMNMEVTETFIMEVIQRGKVYQDHKLSRLSFAGMLRKKRPLRRAETFTLRTHPPWNCPHENLCRRKCAVAYFHVHHIPSGDRPRTYNLRTGALSPVPAFLSCTMAAVSLYGLLCPPDLLVGQREQDRICASSHHYAADGPYIGNFSARFLSSRPGPEVLRIPAVHLVEEVPHGSRTETKLCPLCSYLQRHFSCGMALFKRG